MLIIIEGPDGAGKSSLARKLSDELTARDPSCFVGIRHYGPPTAHPLDEYLRPLTRYQPGLNQHIIIDRYHWGEYVYPKVRGRRSQLDPESWWAIEHYLERLGAVVVQCSQYADSYRETYARRGESLSQLAELPLVERLYAEARTRSVLPFTTYNWQAPSSANIGRIIAVAADRQAHAVELNEFVTYTGPRYPYALLLGDVRHGFNPTSGITNRDPAFVPFRGTSGHFLLSEEVRGQLDLGLANACDQDGVLELLKVLGEPHVVALGRNAQRYLTKLGVPHAAAPHPQYVRRFKNTYRLLYGNLIRNIIGTTEDYASWPNLSPELPARTYTHLSSKEFASQAASRKAATVPFST